MRNNLYAPSLPLSLNLSNVSQDLGANRKYKDCVYRKMLVQEYLKK